MCTYLVGLHEQLNRIDVYLHFRPDPPENCFLNVKKLPEDCHCFFSKNAKNAQKRQKVQNPKKCTNEN